MVGEATSLERTRLQQEVFAYADFLDSSEIIDEVRKYEFKASGIARVIGRLAGALASTDGTERGIELAEVLSHKFDLQGRDLFSLWYNMDLPDDPEVRDKLVSSAGVRVEDEGDMTDWYKVPIMDLLAMKNQETMSAARSMLDNPPNDDSILSKTKLAIRLFEADSSTPFNLILKVATQAREYALENAPPEEEPTAEQADDFSVILNAISFALSPRKSELEKLYVYTDIELHRFARKLLEENKIEEADKIQELMLSPFYIAELNSDRVALGQDPDNKYAEAVIEYLDVYGDIQEHHLTAMANNLVIGRYEPAVLQYKELLLHDDVVKLADEIPPESLVALYKAGEIEAYSKLMQLYPFAGANQWKYPDALIEMGKLEEAMRLMYSRFNADPSFNNGLAILNKEFDFDVYMRTQRAVPEYRGNDVIGIMESKTYALGRLALYIRAGQNKHDENRD